MSRKIEYICPFVPAELIAAWGFEPVCKKLIGGEAQDNTTENSTKPHHNLSAGVCPISESMLYEFAQTSAAGVIFSTTCDQMRRAHEIFLELRGDIPSFLLNVPVSWQDPACVKYYRSELERLGEFLSRIGGRRPDAKTLADTIRRYAKQREELYTAKNRNESRINIAFVGSELRQEDDWIFSYVHQFGGQVVLDATCNGEMVLPGCVLPDGLDDDPLGTLAEMYFALPHPHQRPDSKFFDYVTTQIIQRNVKGVILIHMSWCDTCHGFARRLKQKLSVPLLQIAEADQPTAKAHIQSRLSAFGEMLN